MTTDEMSADGVKESEDSAGDVPSPERSANGIGVLFHIGICTFFIFQFFNSAGATGIKASLYAPWLAIIPVFNIIGSSFGMSVYYGFHWLLWVPVISLTFLFINKRSTTYNVVLGAIYIAGLLAISSATFREMSEEEIVKSCEDELAVFLNNRYGGMDENQMMMKYIDSDERKKRVKYGAKILRRHRIIAKRNGFDDLYNQMGLIMKVYQGRSDEVKEKEAKSLLNSKHNWEPFTKHLEIATQ